MMKNKGLLIFGGVAVFFLLVGIMIGNSLQTADEKIDAKWAQVENQLMRRYELIPDLVAIVKGYSEYESDTLQAITDARSSCDAATNKTELANAENELSNAITNLKISVEAYPELKANEQYQSLMIELAGTTNRIAIARKDYNESIQELNGRIRRFPTSIIASMSGIEKREYFKVSEEESKKPIVDFSKKK